MSMIKNLGVVIYFLAIYACFWLVQFSGFWLLPWLILQISVQKIPRFLQVVIVVWLGWQFDVIWQVPLGYHLLWFLLSWLVLNLVFVTKLRKSWQDWLLWPMLFGWLLVAQNWWLMEISVWSLVQIGLYLIWWSWWKYVK